MPTNSLVRLKIFNKQVERKRVSFACPRCNALLLSKNFQKHCAQAHELNPLLCCVWCWGEMNWSKGEKNKHVDHMFRCWQDFMARHAAPPDDDHPPPPPPSSLPPPPPSITEDLIVQFDTTPMCPKRDFFSRPRVLQHADTFYDPIWPLPLCPDDNTLTFSGCEGGLDLAASCIRLYIRLRETMDFFHAMVRAVAFPSFARAMDEDEGVSRTLPFWTLCNGGAWQEAKYRQHRHMIVVSPKGHFHHRVWCKVRPDDRPSSDYKCKYSEPIKSAKHFIYTLGYLSKRESSCNFTMPNLTITTTTKLNHFYIYTPLPKNYELVLASQYEGGICELLGWKYPNFAIDQLLRLPVEFVDHKWRLKIKHLPEIPLGIRLPISEDLVPCSHQTTAFIHLAGDKKIYFERGSSQNNHPTFYHAVGEEYFTFQKRHQRDLSLTKPMAAEINRLKRQVDDLTAENTRYKRKIDKLDQRNQELDQRNQELGRQFEKSTAEKARMQRLLQNEIIKSQRWKRNAQKWQRENYVLHQKIIKLYENEVVVKYKEENDRLKGEIIKYKDENDRLKGEIIKYKDENDRLKGEIIKYKDENDRLKGEIIKDEIVKYKDEPAGLRLIW